MDSHIIQAVLLSDRQLFEQHKAAQFEKVQAVWLWRTVNEHLVEFDELPAEDALCHYVDTMVNKELQAILPTYLARVKAVNVSNFQLDQVTTELEKERQKQLANSIVEALVNGNMLERIKEIANEKPAVKCSPLRLNDIEVMPDPKLITQWLGWRGESTLLDGGPKTGKSTIGASDCVNLLNAGGTVLWCLPMNH